MSWNEYYNKKAKEYTGIDRSSRLHAIGKTYFGKPIDDEQLEILADNIYQLIGDSRQLKSIIDLGCGTGIISEKLIEKYEGIRLTLVDPNLDNINKCKTLFGHIPLVNFYHFDHRQTIDLASTDTLVFTYEVIQHLSLDDVMEFVHSLFEKNVLKIVLGGVPDLSRRDNFYKNRTEKPQLKNHADSVIGQWYDQCFFTDLASEAFKVTIRDQNKLYTSHYRFDVSYERETF